MAKILFLILDFDKPSSKKRVLGSLDYVRSRGHEVDVRKVPMAAMERIGLLGGARSFDLVILQKKLFSPVQFHLLRLACKHLVFDFDDAVMFHEVERNEPVRGKFFSRFLTTVSGCAGVIAGNAYLAEFARAARTRIPGLDDRVIVLPTPVDTERLLCRNHGRVEKDVTIGWIGTKGNQVHLDQVHAALKSATQSSPEARFKVVSDAQPHPRDLPLIFKSWNQADEEEDLRSFDIGIMPLADNMWTRGKGGYKLLQYMAAGVASVASPVGINTEIIRHGENGYLARNEKEWAEILAALIKDSGLRARIGRAARETVERGYNLRDYNRRLADFLESLP